MSQYALENFVDILRFDNVHEDLSSTFDTKRISRVPLRRHETVGCWTLPLPFPHPGPPRGEGGLLAAVVSAVLTVCLTVA